MKKEDKLQKQHKMIQPSNRYIKKNIYFYRVMLNEFLQIKLDIAEQGSKDFNGYDASNPLILPSKKRESKIRKNNEHGTITRILSKKQRKNLEKIVDKKVKKEGVRTTFYGIF